MKLNISFDIAIIISLVAVFLFANGQAYLGGYLGVFGIDAISLNYSIQDKVYYGYIKGFNYLLYFIYTLIIITILWYVTKAIDLSRRFKKITHKIFFKNILPQEKNLSIHNDTFNENIDNIYNRSSFLAISVLIFLISTLYLLSNTEKEAKTIAKNEIKNFDFRQVQLKDKNSKSDVFLIKCGTTLCALIDRNKNVTLEDPKNIIFFVKAEKK